MLIDAIRFLKNRYAMLVPGKGRVLPILVKVRIDEQSIIGR